MQMGSPRTVFLARLAAIVIAVAAIYALAPAREAHAACCAEPNCCGNEGDSVDSVLDNVDATFQYETGAVDRASPTNSAPGANEMDNVDGSGEPTGLTPIHFTVEMQKHTLWWVNEYFVDYWLPAMMRMAEHLSAIGMYQISVLGSLLDAKQQLETQRAFSALAAQAQRDYHPSDFLCTIGSNVRSLGTSEQNADATALALSERAIDRQTLNVNTDGTEGPTGDRQGRLAQFTKTYCDGNDFGQALQTVCAGPLPQSRRNRDIDYTRLIAEPLTLNINFTDATLTDDEEDVLALAANLYSHDVFAQVDFQKFDAAEGNRQRYLNLRAIVAKRSVAQQSFNAIAGMKSSGSITAGNAVFLREIMRDLRIASNAEIDAIIGTNPSYYAQMEILTKKIYQNHNFIVRLYDKPANVARQGLALQAFNLMQSHDLYESDLRTEAMLQVWLETEIMKEQSGVQRIIAPLTEGRR